MRTILSRLLTLAALLWVGVAGHADTLKLRDGTTLEGSITGETTNAITVDVEFAGGTIHQTRTVEKSDIAEVKRWTDAEKKQAQMEKDYRAALKHRLDPARSFTVAQYDQIISNTFSRFLAEYPDSPHTNDIAAQLNEWQGERDRVAGGEAKYGGAWRPADEVAGLMEKDNGQQWLQTARQLIAQNQPDPALPYLRGVAGLKTQPELADEARALLTKTYEQMVGALDGQVSELQKSVAAARQKAEQARQAVAAIEPAAQTIRGTGLKSGKQKGGYQAMGTDATRLADTLARLTQARNELSRAESQLAQLENQLAATQQRSDQLHAAARQVGVQIAGATGETTVASSAATTTVAQAESSSPTGSGDLMDQMGGIFQWIKDHWVLLAGGGLLALWLLSRAMR